MRYAAKQRYARQEYSGSHRRTSQESDARVLIGMLMMGTTGGTVKEFFHVVRKKEMLSFLPVFASG